eukprot:gene37194-48607_t
MHIRTFGTTVNEESLLGSKRRVFWQIVRDVADRQKEIKNVDVVDSALTKVFRSFTSDTERSNDPSSWMPLYWAVLLPSTDIQDIETLIAAQPDAVHSSSYNPFQLACVANARVEVLHLLHDHFPLWVFQMIAEMNMANIAAVYHRGDSVTQMTVYHRRLDILLYIHSIKPELLLKKIWQDDDPFGYQSLYENLTDAKIAEGRNFNYPRRLLLLAGHPSLCLPE